MSEKAIPLLNWLYRTYGGSVRETGKETDKWQARYCWTITTGPAICFLARIHKYMTIKQEIATAILKADLVDNDLWRGKHRKWTQARLAAFEEARNVTLKVNKKGPPKDRPDWIARRVGNRWESKQGNLLTGLSETFSGNWPRTGSMRNGCVFPRPKWAPATGASGGSAGRGDRWTTPQAHDVTERGSGQKPTSAAGNACLARDARTWPTPDCNTATYSNGRMGPNIREAAAMWMTPNVPNGGRHVPPELVDSKGMTADGQKRTVGLESQSKYWNATSWPTPRGADGTKGGPNQAGSKGDLMLPSAAAQWPTPMTVNTTSNRAKYGRETSGPSRGGARFGLEDIVNTWPTPAARDSKGANSAEHALITGGGAQAHGSVEQLRRPFFAPGPADARWPAILREWPGLAPALDKTAESGLRGVADGLADRSHDCRAQRLKCVGNGVVALQAAAAAVVLVRRMMETA